MEVFPLVNEAGEVIGKATRQECHSGSKLLHPVVHLHIFNQKGDLFLQKRSMSKDIQPGKWDTAVGGHVDYGETIEEALRREVREELGVTDFTPQFVQRYVFESAVEKELVNTYRTCYEGPFSPDPEELADARFWTIEEIKANLGKQCFTPNFEQEFKRCFDMESEIQLNAHNKTEYPPMHTAEHILNQTMVRLFGCPRSRNAHIERKKSKCDYELSEAPTPEQMAEIERKVNEVIDQHLPITIEFMRREEAAAIVDLSKLPEEASETLRIVRVGDYDACACIGAHVNNTAEIGHFKLLTYDYADGRLQLRFKLTE